MAVYLIRHGESVLNALKNLALHPDFRDRGDDAVPLTLWGFEQAVEAGKALREELAATSRTGREIRIIYSPFLRTVQTMEGLRKGLGGSVTAEVHPCDDLREQNFGLFNGILDLSYIKRQWPGEYAAFTQARRQSKYHATPPEGESQSDVMKRAGSLVEDYREVFEDPNVDIILVGHGVSNRAVELQLTMGEQLEALDQEDADRQRGRWMQKQGNPKNCVIRKLEGNLKDGYAQAECIYEAKERNGFMPADYKNQPYGMPRTRTR